MVVYIPFGDNQTHGALGKHFIFARRRGKTYAKIYKSPRDPNTPDQQSQRSNFKDAVSAWHALTLEDKNYWRAKASGMSATGYNLFIKYYLLGMLPKPEAFTPEIVNSIVIQNPRSDHSTGFQYMIMNLTMSQQFGYVFDNQNVSGSSGFRPPDWQCLIRVRPINRSVDVHEGDSIIVTYKFTSQLEVFFPALNSNTILYPAMNGGTYYDKDFTQPAYIP